MKCPLNEMINCNQEDIYGACFFCNRVNSSYAVSKIPILETEPIFIEGEDM